MSSKLFCFLALICLPLLFAGCKKDHSPANDVLSDGSKLLSFSFKSSNNPHRLDADVICKIEGNVITGVLPQLTSSKDSLIASFTTAEGVTVMIGSELQISDQTINNYSTPLALKVSSKDFSTTEYTVSLRRFTGLPIVYINTQNSVPITSKDIYVNANLKIDPNNLHRN